MDQNVQIFSVLGRTVTNAYVNVAGILIKTYIFIILRSSLMSLPSHAPLPWPTPSSAKATTVMMFFSVDLFYNCLNFT